MPKDARKRNSPLEFPLGPTAEPMGWASTTPPTGEQRAEEACPSDKMDVGEVLLVVAKDRCCFCGDFMRGLKKNVCKPCGAYVCEQAKAQGNGCIAFKTAPPPSDFLCLPCDAKACRGLHESGRKRLPCDFIGYSGRKRAKLTWPLVLVSMKLSRTVDTPIADSLKLDFKFHYLSSPSNINNGLGDRAKGRGDNQETAQGLPGMVRVIIDAAGMGEAISHRDGRAALLSFPPKLCLRL
ncbi:hypothetical protein L210DRAFT_3653060 [Boletus edulis BED1]|uniref:Uncharacterized protein n=1 Tax=Boletus edulis BED1 TaxID=1328754 RepID=A0AAD4BFC1_BOLED|nr:hypothetical protein L210DRAFT_3653060 [Boletus edulis BED1]